MAVGDYHSLFFVAAFLALVLLSVVFIAPLAILQIIKACRPSVRGAFVLPLPKTLDLSCSLLSSVTIDGRSFLTCLIMRFLPVPSGKCGHVHHGGLRLCFVLVFLRHDHLDLCLLFYTLLRIRLTRDCLPHCSRARFPPVETDVDERQKKLDFGTPLLIPNPLMSTVFFTNSDRLVSNFAAMPYCDPSLDRSHSFDVCGGLDRCRVYS